LPRSARPVSLRVTGPLRVGECLTESSASPRRAAGMKLNAATKSRRLAHMSRVVPRKRNVLGRAARGWKAARHKDRERSSGTVLAPGVAKARGTRYHRGAPGAERARRAKRSGADEARRRAWIRSLRTS
jgi:hypothetical protein